MICDRLFISFNKAYKTVTLFSSAVISSISIAASTTPESNSFTGFSLGAGFTGQTGQVVLRHVRTSVSSISPEIASTASLLGVGAFLSYGYQMHNNVFFGLQTDINYTPGKEINSFQATLPTGETSLFRHTLQFTPDISITAQLGYAVTPRTLIYGFLGPNFFRLSDEVTSTSSSPNFSDNSLSLKSYAAGFAFGLGTKQLHIHKFITGFEFGGSLGYGAKSINDARNQIYIKPKFSIGAISWYSFLL